MFFIFLTAWAVHAQSPGSKKFREESWREVKEGIDYSAYQNKVREWQKRQAEGEGESGEKPDERADPERYHRQSIMIPAGGQFFVYILFIVVLVLILYVFLKNKGFRNRSVEYDNEKISFENIEEKIHETDLDKLLQEALKRGDFLQAIRLLYLNIIKELTNKGLIEWTKNKTNRDYLYELTNGELKLKFEKITLLFEWAWYGDLRMDKKTYTQLEAKFRDLKYTIDHLGD